MGTHRAIAGGIRLVLLACLSMLGPRLAGATEFLVKPGGETKVVFVSTAATEHFEGKTKQMEGRIVTRPDSLGDSITVHLEVDMASLDTGIPMRNQHMRDNHLETKKFPRAIFDGGTITGPRSASRLEPGKPASLDLEGTFTLHGVSRRIVIHAVTTYLADHGGRIAFQAEFPVALADYGISRPQFLFLKLAEVQDVRVSGVATVP